MPSDHHHAHHEHHGHAHVEFRFCPRCGAALQRRLVKKNEPERLVCGGCAFIFYQDPKVVAGTVFMLGGGIVLLKRGVEPGLGKWVFPGGYVDRNEAVRDAAVRETKEECNLDVKLGELLNVYSYPNSAHIIIVYTAEIIGGSLRAADECTETGIFEPAQIPWEEIAFASTHDALRDYLNRYVSA